MASNITSPSVAVRPKQSWWASLVILCAVFGALLGLSVKSRDLIRSESLPAQNYPALTQYYLILKRKDAGDIRTISTLQSQISDLENGTSSNSKQQQALLSDLDQTKFLAGMTPASGEGVEVILNDSKKSAPLGVLSGVGSPNLIHDMDILEVVNELKAAGAEAVSVNSQRIIATTAIRCAGPTIFINNTPETPPYIVRAIGDPKTMAKAINLPGGVGDSIREFDPAMLTMKTAKNIIVPASQGPPTPLYAHPVGLVSSGT